MSQSTFLVKGLYKANQTRNEQIVYQVNDAFIYLRNVVNKNEHPDQVINIFEKFLEAGNTSKKFLNEILQIICSFYRSKEIAKKV